MIEKPILYGELNVSSFKELGKGYMHGFWGIRPELYLSGLCNCMWDSQCFLIFIVCH